MGNIRESYNANDDGASTFGSAGPLTYKAGQTFEAAGSYSIASVKLKMYRVGTPGTVTIGIYAVDGSDLPTGSALASGTTNGNLFTTSTSGAWYEVTFSSAYSVVSGTTYAIVASASGWQAYWRTDSSSPTYTGGKGVYYNNVSWGNLSPDTDFMFENYDNFTPPTDIVTIKKLVAVSGDKVYYENV